VKPLPDRINLVISRNHQISESVNLKIFKSYQDATSYALSLQKPIFIIGGAQIYNQAFQDSRVQKIYQTQILKEFKADTYIPEINPIIYKLETYSDLIIENDIPYQFIEYQRQVIKRVPEIPLSHQEYQYINLAENVLRFGNVKGDRTGTGVKSLFGAQMRFDLSKSFPLLTTKKVFWRGIVEELLWIISGSTDATVLSKKGVHIWDADTSRETLDKRGFTQRAVGSIGAGYGFQLRHCGAKYIDSQTDYKDQGIDQLQNAIDLIKTDSNSRRIVVCLWNPVDLPKMTLPVCHMFFQFYVNDGKLSCLLYLRSSDFSLGTSFNIASYALLTNMIAQVTNLKPEELIIVCGDYHIYQNQIPGMEELIKRDSLEFPKLELNPEIKCIDDFKFDDIKLMAYQSHGVLKMPLSV
jgi:dihydrofolate reductase/thymidylate synthase